MFQNKNQLVLQLTFIQRNINMLKKYDSNYNFYLAKSITPIIYDIQYSHQAIGFKDVMIFMENNQYLKRYYQIKNNYGRNQISQRIKTLADFFASNPMTSFQYPTMIISNTKVIFQRRLKRIQRCQNGYDSSNDDDQQQQKQDNTPICGSYSYLKSQTSQQLQKKSQNNQISNNQIQDALLNQSNKYQQSVHDVYEEYDQDMNINNKGKPFFLLSNIIPVERQINHLICDFQDLDQQKIRKQYQNLQNKKKNQNKSRINIGLKNQIEATISSKQVNSPKNITKSINLQHQNKYGFKGQQKKTQLSHINNTITQSKISIHQINKDKNIGKMHSGLGSPINNQQKSQKIRIQSLNSPKNEEINELKFPNQQKLSKQAQVQKILQKYHKNQQTTKQQQKKIQQLQQRRKQIEKFKLKNQYQCQNKIQQNKKNQKRLVNVKSQTKLHHIIQGGKKLDLNKLIVTKSKQEDYHLLINKNNTYKNMQGFEQNIRNTDSGVRIDHLDRKYQHHIKKNNFMQKQTIPSKNQKVQPKIQYHNNNQIKKIDYKYMKIKTDGKQEYSKNNLVNHSKLAQDHHTLNEDISDLNQTSPLINDIKSLKSVKSSHNLNKVSFNDEGHYKARWKG